MKQNFSIPLTRAQFESARYRLMTQHFVTAGNAADHGTLSARGVTLDYSYDGAALNVEIDHKPALFSEGFVEAKIRDWFTKV